MPFKVEWEAQALNENKNIAFVGVTPIGNFFIPQKDLNSIELGVKKQFYSGKDLNQQNSILKPTRWIVDFNELSLENITKKYPNALKLIRKQVKPKRENLKQNT